MTSLPRSKLSFSSILLLGAILTVLTLFLLRLYFGPEENFKNPNSFIGTIQKEKYPGNHTYKLLSDFTFIDPNGRVWTAPKGAIVNGASIPGDFWGIIGSPWAGRYPEASVIHDHFCQTKSRHWKDVHRVFYEAMIANKVKAIKAKLMYYAVYRYGPRWTDTEKNFQTCLLYWGLEQAQSSKSKDSGSTPIIRGKHNKEDIVIRNFNGTGACAFAPSYKGRLVIEPKINKKYKEKIFQNMERRIKDENLSLEAIEAIASADVKKDIVKEKSYLLKESQKDTKLLPLVEALKEMELMD